MNPRKRTLLATSLAALAMTATLPSVKAGAILNLGGGLSYGILEIGNNNTVTINGGHNYAAGDIQGNIGITSNSKFSDSGPDLINGTLQFSGAANTAISNTTITDNGGVAQTNVAAVNQADIDVLNGSAGYAALGGSVLNFSNFNGGLLNVDTTPGMTYVSNGVTTHVYDITSSFTFTKGITLQGNANDLVVFNIGNNVAIKFQNQTDDAISGLTSDQILWNFIGANDSLTSSGGCNGCGGLHGSQNVYGDFFIGSGTNMNTNEINFQGRVLADANVTIVSNGFMTAPFEQVAPEPGTMSLFGIAGVAIGLLGRKRFGSR